MEDEKVYNVISIIKDMDFWQDKNDEYRFKMIDVYNEQRYSRFVR